MFRLSRCQRAFALGVAFILATTFARLRPIALSARAFSRPRWRSTIRVSPTSCRCRRWTGSKTGDIPPASEMDMSAEFDKRITEDLGISISDVWTQIRAAGGPTWQGFGDLETTLQYQLLKDASNETAMLLGLIVDWGGTGNDQCRNRHALLVCSRRPTISARDSADCPTSSGSRGRSRVTGQIGYQIPTTSFIFAGRQRSAGARLRRVAAIQHAVSEIGGERPSASRLYQSSDPDCRNAVLRRRSPTISAISTHDRHDQSGRDLGRELFSRSASRPSSRSTAPAATASA